MKITLSLTDKEHETLLTILISAKNEDLKGLQIYKRDIIEFITTLQDF